jgi:hypothetical protein
MLQSWLEMKDIVSRKFNNAVWIPIYASQQLEKFGEYGYGGYKEEFFGCGTLAIPIKKRAIANKLSWSDVGLSANHLPYVDDNGIYRTAGSYIAEKVDLEGTFLVLDQSMEQPNISEWHLNQDFVLALGLKREKDVWVCPTEGYIEVARIKRKPDGTPNLLEVRAEHLKDYLCARKMALLMTTYRERRTITKNKPTLTWKNNAVSHESDADSWRGYIREIHEGGRSFGEEIAIFHASRIDVDAYEDIPIMGPPTDDNVTMKTWTKGFSGSKCYHVCGELWRNEWVEPSMHSPRISRDELPPTVYFITNTEGKRESKDTLKNGRRWLWFTPTIIVNITERRGGFLGWYTMYTGSVGCLQSYGVHFGVNSLGLINVYAKDIAQLPDWQQQIWAGHNISPEGKVSEELLASQVKAEPADTQAPEAFLEDGFRQINILSKDKLGFLLFREHDSIPDILKKCYRFRANDKTGLYALAKDLSRITADAIDSSQIQQIVNPPKGEKWGSLKSLEKLLATKIGAEKSRILVGHLVGIYDLRLADAHLPSGKVEESLMLAGIDSEKPFIHQGMQMMHSCVGSLYLIIDILEKW